jgi:hypothetical protein
MSENINNYLRWIVVVGLLFIPPFLVRGSADGGTIRIIVYCILIFAITLLGAYLAFKRGDIVSGMPIDKHFKTEKSGRTAALFFRGLALLMTATGVYMAADIAPPLFSYAIAHRPAIVETDVVRAVTSPAMPGAFYVYMGVSTINDKHLSFSYPSPILQAGHNYMFILLPNSNFILMARQID